MPWLPKRAPMLPNNPNLHLPKGTKMSGAAVVQGRTPVTAPARPGVHWKVKVPTNLILETPRSLHRIAGEARGLLSDLGPLHPSPGCHGRCHT